MPLWILCGGRRYAGKDTVADMLADRVTDQAPSYTVVRTSFAALAKREFCAERGLDVDAMLTDVAYKERHRTGLVEFAMGKRAHNPDYFVRAVYQDCCYADVIIISDYRFANERTFLQQTPGAVCVGVGVQATDEVRRGRGWIYAADVDESPSERGADLVFEHTVKNNDSLSRLGVVVRSVFNHMWAEVMMADKVS